MKSVAGKFRVDSRTVLPAGPACVCQVGRGVPLGMSRIHPECPDSNPSDRSVAADVLVREEPNEEEEDEEEDGGEKEGEEGRYHCGGPPVSMLIEAS